jgi:hypothetical protein
MIHLRVWMGACRPPRPAPPRILLFHSLSSSASSRLCLPAWASRPASTSRRIKSLHNALPGEKACLLTTGRQGCGRIYVRAADRTCHRPRAVLAGLTFYDALTGLLEVGLHGGPRALPWAKVFRPVGAWHVPLDEALKGRHMMAQGNALGPCRIKPSKP